MPTIVKVAVFIDRATAIRAGRNTWGWVPTELDLDQTDAVLREALVACPEHAGAVCLTHVSEAPRMKDDGSSRSAAERLMELGDSTQDRFEYEWRDGPNLSEATPESALEALKHLATKPQRRLARALARKSELEREAAEIAESAAKLADERLAALRAWLSTPPLDLVVEDRAKLAGQRLFSAVEPPERPQFVTASSPRAGASEPFGNEWKRVCRMIASDGQLPEAAELRSKNVLGFLDVFDEEPSEPSFPSLEGVELPACPVLGDAAQERLYKALAELASAVEEHWTEVWRAAHRLQADYEREVEEARLRAAAERHAAEQARREAAAGGRTAINLSEALAWATRRGCGDVVALIRADAPADEIANAMRAAVFDPVREVVPRHRKLTKTDLLVANPGFRDDAKAYEAEFAEQDGDLAGGKESERFSAIVQRLVEIDVPAQYKIRIHRGQLKRRSEAVGVAVETRSVHVTAIFGSLVISRAFELGSAAPVEG